MQQQTIANISKLLQTQSMYDLALDIGISQYSLYCYVNDFVCTAVCCFLIIKVVCIHSRDFQKCERKVNFNYL